MTSTRRAERPSRPPLLRLAKKRTVGCSMPTQIGALVAELPPGSDSDLESFAPATLKDSLPLAIAAPPLRLQPAEAPASKSPPGSGVYCARSSHGVNGVDSDCASQEGAALTRTPALADAAPKERAAAAIEQVEA